MEIDHEMLVAVLGPSLYSAREGAHSWLGHPS